MGYSRHRERPWARFIQQLKHEPPYHFVFPCMHLKREEISALFERELGTAKTDSPEELTMIARRFLRRHYINADMGISGGNFIVAETGMISITENEGNARLTTALPKIHVALVGIEKIIPWAAGRSGAFPPHTRHRRHGPAIDLLQLHVWRAAAAG